MFCKCTTTLKLWEQLQTWIPSLPSLEPEICILGLWNCQSPDFIFINHIILIFKRFIYLKKHEHHININGLKVFIKNIEKVEQKIASQKGKLEFHFKKWDSILPNL